MAQQGSPPPRPSRQAGPGHRAGYDRDGSDTDGYGQDGYDRDSYGQDSYGQDSYAPGDYDQAADEQVGGYDRVGSGRRARTDRLRRERPERPGWQQLDPFGPEPDTDADLPPWAGPVGHQPRRSSPLRDPYGDDEVYDPTGNYPRVPDADGADDAAAGPRSRTRRRGRAAAARLRKSRRRVYRWCGIAIVLCVIAAGITALVTHHAPRQVLYVTSLQPGEFKSVPSACASVSTAVLNQYLPEPGRTSTNELSGGDSSQCSFTVDRKPLFLVLEVSAQAYQPFAAATGSGTAAGSASANAQDNYAQARQQLTSPPKHSPLSVAQLTALPKTGQQAFVAVQREHVSGIVTEVVTVVIRERNLIITVSQSGQESGHGFGPVPVATLQAGAEAAARDVLGKAVKEPTA